MSYPGGWRPHIESALCLDLPGLLRTRAARPGCTVGGVLHWKAGDEEMASVGYRAELGTDSGTLALDYSATDRDSGQRKAVTCRIDLDTLPCHYGGGRWYMRCPYTHRRALKLYKWPGIDLFCHREAIKPRPTYAIQRTSGDDRINTQRWALRRKLHDSITSLMDPPLKPKWMRWRTFQRYADRDAELDARGYPYLARMLGRLGVHDLG
ncbi:MAG TPA: hypothetical protein VF292_07490 [Rhodanobacteraceae bacterium]